jgi:hypothetical protein
MLYNFELAFYQVTSFNDQGTSLVYSHVRNHE